MAEEVSRKAQFRITANVKVLGYDKKDVPDYKTYLKLKESGDLEKFAIYKDEGTNLVVNAGLNQVIALLLGLNTTSFGFCGVGSSSTAVSATDTDLNTPIGRIAVTNAYQVSNVGHWDTFFSSSQDNGTWNESGLFSLVSGGIMLCHKLLSSTFTKSSSNTATVTWTITVTAV